ncbi:MAG: hypothetical protein IKS31_09805 [Clostridia bacterium]|nr:hypothetical protein [Clostridia bacterium]
MEYGHLDKASFILGMVTAFSECVAAGCKKLALSPPLTHDDYVMIADRAYAVIREHGLLYAHETNEDRSEERRFEWILIAARRETLDRYEELRRAGLSPAESLAPFSDLLSYNPAESVQTGCDVYRSLFPLDGNR